MNYDVLPPINASLNALSSILLLCGYYMIRTGRREAHIKFMIAACSTSALFLISYLTYHFHHPATRYHHGGALKAIYFTILISHVILAIAIVPMVIMTLSRAYRRAYESHKKIARLTFPLWLYVSVTGVIIYFMLLPVLAAEAYR